VRSPNYNQRVPTNPVVQVVAVMVAVVVAIGAVFVGAVVLSFLVGFALIGWVILMVRLWWLRRQTSSRSGTRRESGPSEIVGVEYTVLKERSVKQHHEQDS